MDQVVAQALTLYAKISGVRRSDLLTTYTSNQFTIEMPCPLFTLDD
jgi:hypothetical protein